MIFYDTIFNLIMIMMFAYKMLAIRGLRKVFRLYVHIIFFFQFTDPSLQAFPHPFATSLFSFLYHLASYKTGMFCYVFCSVFILK